MGNDTAKPRSAWEVKRKIRLPTAPANPADVAALERALGDIAGVLQVAADCAKRAVAVRYLITETDYQTLEQALEAAGFPPANGR